MKNKYTFWFKFSTKTETSKVACAKLDFANWDEARYRAMMLNKEGFVSGKRITAISGTDGKFCLV